MKFWDDNIDYGARLIILVAFVASVILTTVLAVLVDARLKTIEEKQTSAQQIQVHSGVRQNVICNFTNIFADTH